MRHGNNQGMDMYAHRTLCNARGAVTSVHIETSDGTFIVKCILSQSEDFSYHLLVVVSYKRKYVLELLINRLFKPVQEKVWLGELTVPP